MDNSIETSYRESSLNFQNLNNLKSQLEKTQITEKPVDVLEKNTMLEEESKQEKKKIQENMTMNLNEVKNFLFMLIGNEVKMKSENIQSGKIFNSLA